jgi:hypothetical protein
MSGALRLGLYLKRPRTCPCGRVFIAASPPATYCSTPCRVGYTRRYGNPGCLKERSA